MTKQNQGSIDLRLPINTISAGYTWIVGMNFLAITFTNDFQNIRANIWPRIFGVLEGGCSFFTLETTTTTETTQPEDHF